MLADVYERAMGVEGAMPKQTREQSQGVAGEGLVNEWLLLVEGSYGAATRGVIFSERSVHYLREEFGGGSEAGGAAGVAAVQWLAEDELAAGRAVSEVEVVRDGRIARDQPFDGRARGASVDATDYDLGFVEFLAGTDVIRKRLPSQAPEQVDS